MTLEPSFKSAVMIMKVLYTRHRFR